MPRKPDQVKSVSFQPAYVVSVFVGFRSKEKPRNDEEQDFRFCPPRSLTRPIFRAVFDSSFFALKPNENACYAGESYLILLLNAYITRKAHSR